MFLINRGDEYNQEIEDRLMSIFQINDPGQIANLLPPFDDFLEGPPPSGDGGNGPPPTGQASTEMPPEGDHQPPNGEEARCLEDSFEDMRRMA